MPLATEEAARETMATIDAENFILKSFKDDSSMTSKGW